MTNIPRLQVKFLPGHTLTIESNQMAWNITTLVVASGLAITGVHLNNTAYPSYRFRWAEPSTDLLVAWSPEPEHAVMLWGLPTTTTVSVMREGSLWFLWVILGFKKLLVHRDETFLKVVENYAKQTLGRESLILLGVSKLLHWHSLIHWNFSWVQMEYSHISAGSVV